MNNETANAEVTNVELPPTTPEVTPQAPAAAPVIIPKMDLHTVAVAIAAAIPELQVRPTDSTGYRVLGTAQNTDLNWKKGLFYQLSHYAKGLVFELRLYSVKKGAHLEAYAPMFKKFASEKIAYEPLNFACKLRIKMPSTLGEAGMVAAAQEFYTLVEPTVAEVRLLLKDSDFVSKKETKAVPPVAAAPVTESTAEAPAAETAPVAEAPAAAETTAEIPAAAPAVVKQAAKKNHGKRK